MEANTIFSYLIGFIIGFILNICLFGSQFNHLNTIQPINKTSIPISIVSTNLLRNSKMIIENVTKIDYYAF